MDDCPTIDELHLLVTGNPTYAAHAQRCLACQGVLALIADREEVPLESFECAEVELLVAARDTGTITPADERRLAAHAEECAACRDLVHGDSDS